MQETKLKTAIAELEKMEDAFMSTVTKAAATAGEPLKGPWEHVLSAMKLKGTDTGAQATSAVQQLMSQTQTAIRDSRAMGLKTAQALLDGYSAMVSGVLIGMSQGLQQGSPAAAAAEAGARLGARSQAARQADGLSDGDGSVRRRCSFGFLKMR